MKKYIIMFLLMGSARYLFAQKKLIDTTSYNNWQYLNGATISGDGNFVTYSTNQGGRVSHKLLSYTVQSTQMNWKIELFDIKDTPKFTKNSKFCVFLAQNDSLKVINLNSKSTEAISNVSELMFKDHIGDWIIYRQTNKGQTIFLKNLKTRKLLSYPEVTEGFISEDDSVLILNRFYDDIGGKRQRIDRINLKNGEIVPIWKGNNAQDLIVNFKSKQFAFKVADSIFYYKFGMPAPVLISGELKFEIKPGFKLLNLAKFSATGDRIFISLIRKTPPSYIIDKTAPEIWSYLDKKLQFIQENEVNDISGNYMGPIRLSDRRLFQFNIDQANNKEYEDAFLNFYTPGKGDRMESWWNDSSKGYFDLINTKSGTRKKIEFLSNEGILNPELSPSGRFVIYYNVNELGYECYDTSSERIHKLTKNLNVSWKSAEHDYLEFNHSYMYRGIAAWTLNDDAVLIYDSNDVWQFDPLGKVPPINVTNGYGRMHNIVFTLISNDGASRAIIPKKGTLLFSALNLKNKDNGFFSKNRDNNGDPEELTMGPYLYKINSINAFRSSFDFDPIKAKKADLYLIRRQSTSHAPNYFTTRDFKSFRQLTDVQSQTDYNWYKSELHTWKSISGENLQGILYKPLNFDSTKSYPVIFYYYQKLSDGLNAYLSPDYSYGAIDIPTYVSNGYLVFCPDINYKIGDPMQGTYDAVVSCANYISKLPFVDAKKFGLQGHSFGAIQTNYLITRTKLFAAACSGSGLGDWVSDYTSLYGNIRDGYAFGKFGQFEFEGQLRMERSLWSNLAGYLKNSPILLADKITTPILLMHTKNDKTCPYSNALEFFLSLRRLGKKSWFIVYSQGSHSLNGKESEDFTVRMRQFFDHYLMDKTAPLWMLDGVEPKDRAFGAGTQLDSIGRMPGQGLLTESQQKEADSLMTSKPMTITLR